MDCFSRSHGNCKNRDVLDPNSRCDSSCSRARGAPRNCDPHLTFPNSQYSLKFLFFFPGKPFLHSAPPGATSPWHRNSCPRLGILEEIWAGLVQFPLEFLLEFPLFQSPLTISSRRCRAAAPCIQKKIPWIPQ